MGVFLLFILIVFWLCCGAWGILLPQPGTEPGAMAVKALSPNHQTARELLGVGMILMRSKLPTSTDVAYRTDWQNENHLPNPGRPFKTLLKTHPCSSTVLTVGELHRVRFSVLTSSFNQQAFIGLHSKPGTVLVIQPKKNEKYCSKCQHCLRDSLKSFKYICPGPKYTSSSQRLYYFLATPFIKSSFLFHNLPWPQRELGEEGICRMLWVN